MKYYCYLLLWSLSFFAYGQESPRSIQIYPSINGQALELEKRYYVPELEDSITFDRLKFYVSHVQLFNGDEKRAELEKSHMLIDVENPQSLYLTTDSNLSLDFDRIKFNLGIDSMASVSGAFGGDLDPTKGMYWTWQSGYIHVKIEGHADKCPARKNKFQFHIGGYQHPFNSLQTLELKVDKSGPIIIEFDLNKLLGQLDLKQDYQIMSPGTKAVQLAKEITQIFQVLP